VKGETLDAVLLVSHKDRTSPGGHFTHWIKSSESHDEHLRFAYVAFSRPKHLLVLAVNPGNDEDLKLFTEMGFELYQ
jgi:DNA helicase-2/ATP-dependent DNA helicase PcrA